MPSPMSPQDTMDLAKQIFAHSAADLDRFDTDTETLAENALRRAGEFALILNDTIRQASEDQQAQAAPQRTPVPSMIRRRPTYSNGQRTR